MIIRGGLPKVMRRSVPAVPGAAYTEDTQLLQHHFLVDTPTVWVRVKNVDDAIPLRVFLDKAPALDPASHADYVELAAGEVLEGMFEARNVWLFGDGGEGLVEAVFGQRVI